MKFPKTAQQYYDLSCWLRGIAISIGIVGLFLISLLCGCDECGDDRYGYVDLIETHPLEIDIDRMMKEIERDKEKPASERDVSEMASNFSR